MPDSLTKTPRPFRDFSVKWDIDDEKCLKCSDKPCLKSCPIDAIKYDDGIFLTSDCFGCVLCRNACPYDAIHIEQKLSEPLRENPPNINTKLCRACGACVQACKNGAIHLTSKGDGKFHSEIDSDKCIGCGYCYRVCPADAIKYGTILPKTIEGGNAIVINQDLCIGCMSCMRVCPSKGSIAVSTNNLPYINPSYCARCEECMNVCPSLCIEYTGREEAFEIYDKIKSLNLTKEILDGDLETLANDVIEVDALLEDMSMKFNDLKDNEVDTIKDSEILRVEIMDTFKHNLNSYIQKDIHVEEITDLVEFYPPIREIEVIEENCIGCGLCIDECPVNAISANLPEPINIDENCVYCGICVDVCSFDAIKLIESYYESVNNNLYFIRSSVKGLREGYFTIVNEYCQSCGVCVNSCPVDALKMINDEVSCNEELCINCRECESICPVNAIRLIIK